jgi:hypothetical protein
MSEKNAITVIIVAVIGAIGAIMAACIGLIPTILPIVRPTTTPLVFVTEIFVSTNTPMPETPSVTSAPTDTPTTTATSQPLETATETPTTIPTPASSSSDLGDYEGTWVNIDDEPASDKVNLVVTRIDITETGSTTANVSVCRLGENGDVYVQPNPTAASMYNFGLAARDLTWSRFENLRWAVIGQLADNQLVATVQEYDTNGVLLESDTYQLRKLSVLDVIGLSPCANPVTPTP